MNSSTQLIQCQKDLFDLPKDLTYLNCAYMSPMMKKVAEVGINGVNGKRNPTSIGPDDFFNNSRALREEFAKLIHAHADQIAIIPSVSYGMANVVQNVKLKQGDRVVVVEEQFPSNYYPWHKACVKNNAELHIVKAPASEKRGENWNLEIINAIAPNTKVVAISHVHWADGTKYDLIAIREKTREVGALLIIDGTQSVGALPFDCSVIQPDALICAGYKWLMGPYSTGVAYYGPYFENGNPIEDNWISRLNSENFTGLVNYETEYQPGAFRYQVGEHSNFILTPMLLEAIKTINSWGVQSIQDYCTSLLNDEIVETFILEDKKYRANHLFGVRLGEEKLPEIRERLVKENISVSYRGSAIRISPNVYNTSDEMEKLFTILESYL